MKQLGLLVLSFFVLSVMNAQQSKIVCAYDLAVDKMEENYPGYKEVVNNTQKAAQQHGLLTRGEKTVYTIPLVVHVVWKEDAENLADSIIMDQIRILNEDYGRRNPDTVNLRPIFHDIAGNPNIQFELQEIIRVNTTQEFEVDLFGGLPDNVKSTDGGGSDPWDTEKYLNLWICQIQPISFGGLEVGQVLGYAYPPAGLDFWPEEAVAPSPAFEGVVIDYRTVGSNNPNGVDNPETGEPLEVRGRTAIHEIGHYLGLRHIWGDGGGLLGGDSCEADDGIEDTPNSGGQAGFTCDITTNSCIDPADDLPDMIENYMDYAAETCMNSFTQGQIDVMRGVLELQRCGLINACIDVSTNDLNAAKEITLFPNPNAGIFSLSSETKDLSTYQIRLTDISGRTIQHLQLNNSTEIDVTSKSKGLYFLEFDNGVERFVKKLLINK